ncbi:MAG: ATP-binding protein [Lentihominibacter sp.]|nr:ATP-binding protein [Bacillota bacterium]MDY4959123.1 ATP-binding protein [Lentihominibacter sp.]
MFTVSDRGSGIDEETLPHIFERRYSGSKRLETNTGLGLYISNQIILQHSGHMDAANNRFGGADISFTIPYY